MKNYKCLNKIPEEIDFVIEKINYAIKGKILYMTYSENGFIFIITDLNHFYLIKEKKEISIKEYQIM